MRQIKFKGKRIANGEWVYSENYKKDKYLAIAGIELTFVGDYEVDPETVGQFTGLKDKNGTEIYEGDTFQWENDKGIIKFRDGGFYIDWIVPFTWGIKNGLHYYYGEGMVIGNIHEVVS